jgi:hypothetical protein
VLPALITLAQAEVEEETSKTAFYVIGAVWAAFAVVVGIVGIRAHATFPPGQGPARAVMGLAVLLAVGTMTAAVLTS